VIIENELKVKKKTPLQGPVVRKPVNAKLGLKFKQGFCFSYFKGVFAANYE